MKPAWSEEKADMKLDQLLTFARQLAFSTAATGTAKIGTVIDLGADRQIALGNGIMFHATVSTAATSSGLTTVALQLVSADDAALTSDVKVHLTSATFAVADLTKGRLIMASALPWDLTNYNRYLGIRQVVGAAATLTTGALNAHLAAEPRGWSPYTAWTGGAL
jgi:hypothetical protein